jgi:hypothetical protein
LHFGEIENSDGLCLPSSDRTFKNFRLFNKYTKELFYSVAYSGVFKLFVQYKNNANSSSFKENSKTEVKDITAPTFAESKVMPMDSELTGENYLSDPSHRGCFVAYKIPSKRHGKIPEQVVEQLEREMYIFKSESDGVILVERVDREEKRTNVRTGHRLFFVTSATSSFDVLNFASLSFRERRVTPTGLSSSSLNCISRNCKRPKSERGRHIVAIPNRSSVFFSQL